MKALLRFACLLGLLLAAPAAAQVAVPALTGRVVDQTATLSRATIDQLDRKLEAFEARKGSQIAVLLVPSTSPESIEQFSIRVAEAWKIGRRRIDDGAILVIAKNDRKLRIEVGYGLEGALPDATTKRILDEIVTPRFRAGDFDRGVADGVDRMIAVIDGEPLPPPAPAQPRGQSGIFDGVDPFNPVLIGAAIFAGMILRAIFGRLLGSIANAGLVGVLAWWLLGALPVALVIAVVVFFFTLIGDAFVGSGGGGTIRGGGGGWSGGSSSGGGFSGGGGSFGGGGASGSW